MLDVGMEMEMEVATPESVRERVESASARDDDNATARDDSIPLTATAPDDADAIANAGDALDKLSTEEAVVATPPKAIVGVRTLKVRSKYHGEINASDEPHGVGVLDSCFNSKYAGDFCDGKKHGHGVQVFINGSTYAGEFVDDQPRGYGVYTSPFAEKYTGQWSQSARNGMGVCMESNAQLVFGQFVDNELDNEMPVSWGSVQEHMQKALVAERRALRSQETARECHIQAVLEELSTVGASLLSIACVRVMEVLLCVPPDCRHHVVRRHRADSTI